MFGVSGGDDSPSTAAQENLSRTAITLEKIEEKEPAMGGKAAPPATATNPAIREYSTRLLKRKQK